MGATDNVHHGDEFGRRGEEFERATVDEGECWGDIAPVVVEGFSELGEGDFEVLRGASISEGRIIILLAEASRSLSLPASPGAIS